MNVTYFIQELSLTSNIARHIDQRSPQMLISLIEMSGCWTEEDEQQDSAPNLLVKMASLKEDLNSRKCINVA
jgi:hypothetical protein